MRKEKSRVRKGRRRMRYVEKEKGTKKEVRGKRK